MIPYFQFPELNVGPLKFGIFGAFVGAGVLLGTATVLREARRRGLDDAPLRDFAFWGVFSGLVAGHFVHLFLYHPEELQTGGYLQIVKIWDGLSSFGGILGGALVAAVFFPWRGLRFSTYADALALGVAPGWAVARLGCFAVHDHPGVRTSFALAVNFPGGARHDLGLYDAIVLFAIAAALHLLASRRMLAGRLLGLLALLYGLARFSLDFLRARDIAYADARYSGLTPAQYGCVLLVVYGAAMLLRPRPGGTPSAKATSTSNLTPTSNPTSTSNLKFGSGSV